MATTSDHPRGEWPLWVFLTVLIGGTAGLAAVLYLVSKVLPREVGWAIAVLLLLIAAAIRFIGRREARRGAHRSGPGQGPTESGGRGRPDR